MTDLPTELVRICFESGEPAGRRFERVRNCSNGEWYRALSLIDQHRLAPILCYRLDRLGLTEHVPAEYVTLLRKAYRDCQVKNRLRLFSLDRALGALAAQGIEPIVMKGAVLVDSFYPELGTRPMQDVDLVVDQSQSSAAHETLRTLGFRPRTEHGAQDAYYLVNELGVMLDVHFRFRIFEGCGELSMPMHPAHFRRETMRVLQPDAMVVHLVVHMNGHRRESGPLLIWYLDLALVLQRWKDEFDAQHLLELLPSRDEATHLGDALAFLRDELAQVLPASVAGLATERSPERVDTLLAQRSLALWGLPRPRGWLRLLAARARLGARGAWPVPRNRDVALWLWRGALRPRTRFQ